MKNILALAVALVCAAQAFSQNEKKLEWKDVAGQWKGHYVDDGTEKTITVVFIDGKCTVDMPDKGIKSAVFDVRLCQAGDVHITEGGLGVGFAFVGTPHGNTIEGKYKVGNVCPAKPPAFKLERVSFSHSR